MLSSVCISCHSLVYFFTFLYYTDVGSLVFAMLSLTSHVYQHRRWSAIFSLIALTFRQTNIIIVAYEIGWTFVDEIRSKNKLSRIFHLYTSRSSDAIETKDYFNVLWNNMRKDSRIILHTIESILWQCRYQFLVIGLFVLCFIKNNYSITLGHQEHHQMVLHLSQIYYFSVYTAFFVGSHLVRS
jgi:alpha-1,2-glucosyltransferase